VGPQPVGGSQAGTPIQGRIYTTIAKASSVTPYLSLPCSAYIIGLVPSEKQLRFRLVLDFYFNSTLIVRFRQTGGKFNGCIFRVTEQYRITR